jgi:hypothetical protein
VPTRGDKIFGVVAILVGIAIVVAAVMDIFVTPWVIIAASAAGITWVTIERRRSPQWRSRRPDR